MENREDLEAWADAVLDAHRSAPRPPRRSPEAMAQAVEELPPTLRFMIKHGHADPDPDMVERMQHSANRARCFENAEAIVTVIGIVALCVFAFSFYGNF